MIYIEEEKWKVVFADHRPLKEVNKLDLCQNSFWLAANTSFSALRYSRTKMYAAFRYSKTWHFRLPKMSFDRGLLADDVQAGFRRIVDMIENYGLERIQEPFVKQVTGKLWEIRVKGKDGIARAMYVTKMSKRVVILHVFVKKTQTTPKAAIDLAIKRAKEHDLL